MKFRPFSCSLVLVATGFVSQAWAHSQMTLPKPREVNVGGGIKMGPCGADPKPATVPAGNTFKPGDKIMMAWTEVIGHPGWYRVALDPNGQAAFVDPTLADYNKFVANPSNPGLTTTTTTTQSGGMWVLGDYMYLHATGVSGTKYTQTLSLPNVTCDKCTLQLIQVMADAGHPYPGSRYYHCADIVLSNSAAGMGGAGGGAGGASAGAGGSNNTGGSVGGGGTAMGGAAGGAAKGGASGSPGAGGSGKGGAQGMAGDTGAGGESGAAGTADTGGSAGNSHRASGGCSFAGETRGAGFVWLLLGAAFLRARRRR